MIIKKVLARSISTVGSVLCLSAATVSAQEVYSSIIGAVSINVPASSDLYVTPSFNNSAVFRSAITSAVDSGDNDGLVNVEFSEATFALDAYESGHSLLIDGAPLEGNVLVGRMFEIIGNSPTTLVVTGLGAATASDLDGLTASIIPSLTLGEMFPDGLGGKVEANPGNPDLVLFVNDNSAGVEGLSPKAFYYYGDIGGTAGWRKVGSPLDQSHDDDVLPLGEGFVVRNNSGVDTSFFLFGEVMLSKVQIPIASKSAGATDNLVGAPRPLSIALGDLGLEAVVTETVSTSEVKDTVRIFDGGAGGKNPVPDAVYCYFSGGWRVVVDGVVDTTGDPLDATLIPAAAAIVVRKIATSQDQVVYWTNSWDLPSQS